MIGKIPAGWRMRDRRPGRGRRTSRGISLLEALLAVTIMGISLTAIMTTFTASLMSGREAELYAEAVLLLEMLDAELRMNEFSPYEMQMGTSTDGQYMWSVTFQSTDLLDLYAVTMEVTWRRGTRTRSVSLNTYHYQEAESVL